MRPMTDQIREALFSTLGESVLGARFLDLYAGSGALGLEALSRGATSADFVERDPRSLRALQKNIETLDATSLATIHRKAALPFAQTLGKLDYDVVFADPPYASGEAGALAQRWIDAPFSRVLSVEHPANESMPPGGTTRRYGSTAITFYRTEG